MYLLTKISYGLPDLGPFYTSGNNLKQESVTVKNKTCGLDPR